MGPASAKILTDVTSGFKNLCYPSQTFVEKFSKFILETICFC